MKRVEVTQTFMNICTMQVCAEQDATDEEMLAVCNKENPAGTTNGWQTVIRETDGKFGREENKAPVTCQDHEDRTHFLVLC